MSYLEFPYIKYSTSGKTKIWGVRGGAAVDLGLISWKGTWRRYIFRPTDNTMFDAACLLEIANFCDVKTKEHKNSPERTV